MRSPRMMNRFNRTETPVLFTEEDLTYLKGLIGSTRTVDGNEITFESILSIRELVILFNVTFNGNPAVAKVAIKYEILNADREYLIESICSDEGIDLLGEQWDSTNEKWLLTEEQEVILNPLIDEAIRTFKYTDTFVKDVSYEASIHRDIKECDTIPKYYGFYEFDDIEVYVLEKLGVDLFHHTPALEVVAIDVIKALECLHTTDCSHPTKKGFIHRDVTPGNILNREGGVCLIDFGITTPAWACQPYDPAEEKTFLLTAGNPSFAPKNAFIGKYTYAGDLEGLCYTLEYLYYGIQTIPWNVLAREKWRSDMSERAYHLRDEFIPSNEKVRKLLEYINTLENEVPDYKKCISFFN